MTGLLAFLGYLLLVALGCIVVAGAIVAIPTFARWIWVYAETHAEKQAEDESVEGHVGNFDEFVPLSEDVAAAEADLPKMGEVA